MAVHLDVARELLPPAPCDDGGALDGLTLLDDGDVLEGLALAGDAGVGVVVHAPLVSRALHDGHVADEHLLILHGGPPAHPCVTVTTAATSIFRFAMCNHLVAAIAFKPVTPCPVSMVVVVAVAMSLSVMMIEGNVPHLSCIVIASSPVVPSRWREIESVSTDVAPLSIGVMGYPPWG